MRDSADVTEIVSAWRVAGGAFFKVKLARSIVCDTSHMFSLKAFSQCARIVEFCSHTLSRSRGVCVRRSQRFPLFAHRVSPVLRSACEMVIIVVCFGCTVGVFLLLARSPQMQKERQQAGENTWRFLEFLFIVTIGVGAFTVRTLFRRWRSASTEVFASEV